MFVDQIVKVHFQTVEEKLEVEHEKEQNERSLSLQWNKIDE